MKTARGVGLSTCRSIHVTKNELSGLRCTVGNRAVSFTSLTVWLGANPPVPSSIANRTFARLLSPLSLGVDHTTSALPSGANAIFGSFSSPWLASVDGVHLARRAPGGAAVTGRRQQHHAHVEGDHPVPAVSGVGRGPGLGPGFGSSSVHAA